MSIRKTGTLVTMTSMSRKTVEIVVRTERDEKGFFFFLGGDDDVFVFSHKVANVTYSTRVRVF